MDIRPNPRSTPGTDGIGGAISSGIDTNCRNEGAGLAVSEGIGGA
jgi:hypothetical protein